MKSFKLLVASLALMFLPLAAHADDAKEYLAKHYGWTIRDSWDIECDASRPAFPKDGVNVFRSYVCRQKDRSFWTVILWRLPTVKPAAFEGSIFSSMAQGLGYGKPDCKEASLPSAVDPNGIARDCAVPLQNGTFYASFYHFEVPMPSGVSYTGKDGKPVTRLAFSIVVQNAGNVDERVQEKLRELVRGMQASPQP